MAWFGHETDVVAASGRRTAIFGSVCVLVVAAAVFALVRSSNSDTSSAEPSNLVTLCPVRCDDSSNRTSGTTGAIRFSVPSGFSASSSFRPVRPLFAAYDGRYLRLDAAGGRPEVLAIITYASPTEVPTRTLAQRLTAVDYFNQQTAAALIVSPTATTVAGIPAVTQSGVQPITTPSGVSRYIYVNWFVFLSATVVEVTCQYLTSKDAVTRGCRSLLDSITAI